MRNSTENATAEARQSRDRSMRAWIAGLASALLLATTVSTLAQTNRIRQSEIILQPSGDVVEHDTFGCAAAISGNTMVIGGFNADGVQVGAGAAFVFERKGNGMGSNREDICL
jgi:hypothetical protein